MKNPVTRQVDGVLTCEAFPRRRGYELVCALVRGDKVTYASHGMYPYKEAAMRVAEEILKKNPRLALLLHSGKSRERGSKEGKGIMPRGRAWIHRGAKCFYCGKPIKTRASQIYLRSEGRYAHRGCHAKRGV